VKSNGQVVHYGATDGDEVDVHTEFLSICDLFDLVNNK
jgi:hypothetical protein